MKKKVKKIDCLKCKKQTDCCQFGAWVDLELAKKIVDLELKGDFFHLERDEHFPSGFKIGTSIEDNHCTFLDPDGLCSIHKIEFNLKPLHCREFPYENGQLAEFADVLCPQAKPKKNKRRKKK